MKARDYNSINWSEHFYLDDSSPSGLRWKSNIYCGEHMKTIAMYSGDIAGSIDSSCQGKLTYWRVCLKGVVYQVHRVVYIISQGFLDNGLKLDHLDGDTSNNSISNLVPKTQKANCQNRGISSINTSGVTGVSFSNKKCGSYWVSTWVGTCGRRLNKCFSVNKLGSEAAKQLAIEHRELTLTLLNSEGASYTDRHKMLNLSGDIVHKA